jgi:predicted PurR-regulated permease PerM
VPMSLVDTRTTRVLFTALLFALVLGFFYVANRTFLAFLFAVFFAYLMDPVVTRVEKFTHSRALAIGAIYLLLIVLLATFLFFVGPQVGHQAQRLTNSLITLTDRVSSGQIAQDIGDGWSHDKKAKLADFLLRHKDSIVPIAQKAGLRLAGLAKESWMLIVIPILAAFFLKDGPAFRETMLSFVQARPQREFLDGVLEDLNEMLAHFIRAQLTLAAFSLVVYTTFMAISRVPYALVLGTAGGMLEFIPVVGSLVAAVLIMGVSLLLGYPHWIMLLAFLGIWRLIQDYAVSPRIMGKSMELHPLAAIFGVLAGGEIAGVLGVYLSIPVMASLRIVFRRWRLYAEKRRFGPLNEYSFGTEISPRK